MEGGQKVPINLEAGLDISSSDMLVPFSQLTFQHNWQKWQGKCLPNSLRFEHDGWAAGWNVYNFEYNPFVEKFGDKYVGVEKLASNMYMASLYDTPEMLNSLQDWRIITESKILSGAVELDNNVVSGELSGFNGSRLGYELQWDVDSKKFEPVDTSIGYMIKNQAIKDGIVTVDVVHGHDSFSGKFKLYVASPMTSSFSQPIAYNGYKNGVHSWGGYTFERGVNSFVVNTPTGRQCEPEIINGHILKFDYEEQVTNELDSFDKFFDLRELRFNDADRQAKYGDVQSFIGEMYTLNLSIDKFYKKFSGLKPGVEGANTDDRGRVVLDSKAKDADFNKFYINTLNNVKDLAPNSDVILDVVLPIWWTIGLERAGSSNLWEYVIRQQGVDVTNRYTMSEVAKQAVYNYGYDWSYHKWFLDRWVRGHGAGSVSTSNHVAITAKEVGNTWLDCLDLFYLNSGSINVGGNRCARDRDALLAVFDGKSQGDGVLSGMRCLDGDFDNWSGCYWSWNTSKQIENNAQLLGYTAYAERGKALSTSMLDNGVFNDIIVDPSTNEVLNGSWDMPVNDNFVFLTRYAYRLMPGDIQDNKYFSFVKDDKNYVVSLSDVYTEELDEESDAQEEYYCYWYLPEDPLTHVSKLSLLREQYVVKEDNDELAVYTNAANEPYNASFVKDGVVYKVRNGNAVVDAEYVFEYNDTKCIGGVLDDSNNFIFFKPDMHSFDGNFYVQKSDDVLDMNSLQFVVLDADKFVLGSNNDYELKEEYADTYAKVGGLRAVVPTEDTIKYTVVKQELSLSDLSPTFTNVAEGTLTELPHKYAAAAVYEGHMLVKLSYRQVGTTQELMDETSGRLSVELVPTNSEYFKKFIQLKVAGSDKRFIFVDRDSSEVASVLASMDPEVTAGLNIVADELFKIRKAGTVIDDWQGGGYVSMDILPSTSDVWPLTFGVKNDEDANATTEVNYPIYMPDRVLTAFSEENRQLATASGTHTNFTYVVGHTKDNSSLNVRVNWTPNYVNAPTTAAISLKVNNRKAFLHDIYTKRLIKLQNAVCTIEDVGSAISTGNSVGISVAVKNSKEDKWIKAKLSFDCASQVITFVDIERATYEIVDSDGNTVIKPYLLYEDVDGSVDFDVSNFLSQPIGKGAQAFLPLALILNFSNCSASFPASAEEGKLIIYDCDSDGDVITLRDTDEQDYMHSGDNESAKHLLKYSMIRRRFLDSMVTVDNVMFDTEDPLLQIVEYSLEYKERFSAMMRAIYGSDGSMFDDSMIKLSYDENTFDLLEDAIITHDYDVVATSVDVRDAAHKKTLGNISPEGQLQLAKQTWNTTADVENYWWVNKSHILELGKQAFTLKCNTKRLHDWNGDIFEDVWSVPRSDVIKGNVYRYFVSSVKVDNVYAFKQDDSNVFRYDEAIFWTVERVTGGIRINVYDIRKRFKRLFGFNIYIRHKELGEQLNSGSVATNEAVYFNTYSQLTAEMVLSKADWSSTVVNNRLIIGCHVSNNFNQWAIVLDLTALKTGSSFIENVIQGYGYVGLHGELTGGMIPVEFFDCVAHGFTGTVQPLSTLDKKIDKQSNNIDSSFEVTSPYDINEVETQVVGTSEQQWYIKKRLHGIVSHIEYINDSDEDDGFEFVPRVVPITNNYESLYASPSFYSSIIGDCMVQVSALYDLLKFPSGMNTVWRLLCGFVGYPLLYNLAPRFSSIVYLQQSLGQYAYVHYNSSRNPAVKEPEDSERTQNGFESGSKDIGPTLNSSYIFDKQKVMQHANISLDYFKSGIIALLLSAFSSALQTTEKKQSVNEEQNTSTFTDKSKHFIENVVENTGNMMASAITTQSKTDMGLTSTVTGLKSLDMFYSTADNQRVFAGPGYTELQFVADCVAQSVTDTQVEGRVTQLFANIKGLTVLQMKLMLQIEAYLITALKDKADALKYGFTGAATALANPGSIAAIVLLAVAGALQVTMAAQEVGVGLIEHFLNSLSMNGLSASTDSQVSRHALSVEGKHKYGEKNEVFMWPCWGVPAGQLKYSDESVVCGVKNTPWELALHASKYYTSVHTNWANVIVNCGAPNMSDNKATTWQMDAVGSDGKYTGTDGDRGVSDVAGDNYRAYRHEGKVPFYQIAPYGEVIERLLPNDMAKIEGVSRILPSVPFKNENIGVSDPAFAPSLIHDYILDKDWQLGVCSSYGLRQWVTVRDTKVINGAPSNIVIDGEFCGIACPYTAIEVKRGIKKAYMRPLAITPNVLALNCTGYNAIYDDDLYHAFDGMSCRLVDLVGSPGLNKAKQSFYYAIQVNDRFKRSNIIPAQEILGNFENEPTTAMDTIDKLWTTLTVAMDEKGLEAGTVGEDKDAVRWSIPVFSEPVSTLPACVKTMTAATLAVVEGVTGLVTAQVTDTNSAYKAPTSVDFSIGKNVYRATEEYICSVTPAEAGNVITDIVPSLGLKFIGSTPTEAYFYSKATRCYYIFTGSNLVKVDMMERFRDIQRGYWDFVNQEVVMPCLMTFKRLNPDVEDTDTETDNVIVPVLSKGTVSGELPPPLTTIFNDRSWYKCLSLPSGFAYQGPNRVIINRAVFTEYMLETMKENLGKWNKVPREKYSFNRAYSEKYDLVTNNVGVAEDGRKRGVSGWTHNPFLLVTSALGMAENTDCLFEWEITFCWPVEMDLLYGPDNYACVNIMGETMTPGGKREARPTHVFLTKELFTRNGSYGYYSFRYQSKNGSGNRERLKIWSDSYIAISSLTCECKVVTQRRSEQLTQQIDVRDLKEL